MRLRSCYLWHKLASYSRSHSGLILPLESTHHGDILPHRGRQQEGTLTHVAYGRRYKLSLPLLLVIVSTAALGSARHLCQDSAEQAGLARANSTSDTHQFATPQAERDTAKSEAGSRPLERCTVAAIPVG